MTHLRAAQAMTDRACQESDVLHEGPRVVFVLFFFSRMACQTSCFTHLFLFSFLFVSFLLVPFWFHCSLLLRAILCAVRHGPWSLDAVDEHPPPSYLQQTYLLIALTLTLTAFTPASCIHRHLQPRERRPPPSQRRTKDQGAHHQIINCTICPTSIHTPLYTQPLLLHTTSALHTNSRMYQILYDIHMGQQGARRRVLACPMTSQDQILI